MKWQPMGLAIAIALVPSAAIAQGQASAASSFSGSVPTSFFSGARSADVLAAQVLLDRAGHSPGVIDGIMGANTKRAIADFRRSSGSTGGSEIDQALLDRLESAHGGDLLTHHIVRESGMGGPFVQVPPDMTAQSELERLGFESPAEALAEKFHMSRALLEALNPGVDFGRAGSRILVVAPGDQALGRQIARIEVDKARSAVRAFASDGALLASYPATVGSATFPSPSGSMTVRAVAHDPVYYFDPSGRDWGPDRKLTIAPGPNNPVGAVWVDLSRDGYGIHGTPEPRLIGKTASHGCVRLTNWDARELAAAVSPGTKVVFVG